MQDGDDSVTAEEAEVRFNTFISLVDEVTGDERDEVFLTLLECLRPRDDYGAYERVLGALRRFDSGRRGQLTAVGIAPLLEQNEVMAGVVLSDLAFDDDRAVGSFNATTATLPVQQRQRLERFIVEQERANGWLDGVRRGRLRVTRAT